MSYVESVQTQSRRRVVLGGLRLAAVLESAFLAAAASAPAECGAESLRGEGAGSKLALLLVGGCLGGVVATLCSRGLRDAPGRHVERQWRRAKSGYAPMESDTEDGEQRQRRVIRQATQALDLSAEADSAHEHPPLAAVPRRPSDVRP